MSSNCPLVPPDLVLLTNMRSELKPAVGFGFCNSSTLVPPAVGPVVMIALGPTDQITAIAFEVSATAVPQLVPAVMAAPPAPLLQT